MLHCIYCTYCMVCWHACTHARMHAHTPHAHTHIHAHTHAHILLYIVWEVLNYALIICRKFSIVHDSQIIQSVPQEGMFAYIHYMTLNDISARGYVRQYCISYISQTEKCVLIGYICCYVVTYLFVIQDVGG